MGGGRGISFGNTRGISLDALSNFLTAVSFIPGVDTFADLAAIPVDLARGDYVSAGLDVLGAIPIVGELADNAKAIDKISDTAKAVDKATDAAKKGKKATLPSNRSQIKHIFGNRHGHLPDTPANRKLLIDTASDDRYYRGTDRYGNDWHTRFDNQGRQIWVRSRNGIINEGGRNDVPKDWNNQTGLYQNQEPRKKRFN